MLFIGDKVKHKTGGPVMVIHEKLINDFGPTSWETKWWDEISRRFEHCEFSAEELIKVD